MEPWPAVRFYGDGPEGESRLNAVAAAHGRAVSALRQHTAQQAAMLTAPLLRIRTLVDDVPAVVAGHARRGLNGTACRWCGSAGSTMHGCVMAPGMHACDSWTRVQCITKGVARVATHVRAPTDLDLDVSLTTALEAAHEGSRVGHAPADVSRHLSTVGSAAAAGNALQALAATAAASTPNKPSFESASITPDNSIGTPGFSLASVDSPGAVPEGGADAHGAGADAAASGERGVGSPGGSIGGAATPSLSASATEAARMSTLEPIKEARESNCVSLSGYAVRCAAGFCPSDTHGIFASPPECPHVVPFMRSCYCHPQDTAE